MRANCWISAAAQSYESKPDFRLGRWWWLSVVPGASGGAAAAGNPREVQRPDAVWCAAASGTGRGRRAAGWTPRHTGAAGCAHSEGEREAA